MRVRFCDDVLDKPEAWHYLDLIVFKFFMTKRHVWDVSKPAAIKRSRWLNAEPGGRWTKQNTAFFEKLVTRDAHRPRRGLAHSLLLCVAMTSAPPETLTPPDAEHVLSQPVHVIVENDESDGAFLQAAIHAFDRVALRNAYRDQLWMFVSAGGSGEIEKRVRVIMSTLRTGHPRVVVIKDGDRLAPSGVRPTRTIKVADEYQLVHEIPIVELRKREAENYLPIEALTERAPREKNDVLRAFAKLKAEQRDYYDMKQGFQRKDGKREIQEPQRSLFGDVDERDLDCLWDGFGERIWTVFKNSADVITKTTLRAACSDDPDEIERILDRIEGLL